MKNYIAIISNNGTKVTKFKDFDTETDAKVHVVKYGGFSAESVGERIEYYVVKDETISYDNDAIKEKEDNDAATAYISRRTNEYPTISDQLDMLWHAIDTGDWTAAKVKTTDFYTKLKKVKDDNPKPS